MKNFGNLFDKETVETISELIESKMYILNNVKDFHDKDEMLANASEKFEETLSNDLKKQFDKLMLLNYQVEDYYFTLAYFLGRQHGEQITKI